LNSERSTNPLPSPGTEQTETEVKIHDLKIGQETSSSAKTAISTYS